MTQSMEELIERLREAKGPAWDRAIDEELIDLACGYEVVRSKWKLTRLSPDAKGENACEFYTRDGNLVEGFSYPTIGKVHPYYHVRTDVMPWGAKGFRDTVDTALQFLIVFMPGAFWMLGKGKASAAEKLFGFQIMFGTDEVIADGESDRAPDAIIIATLTAALNSKASP